MEKKSAIRLGTIVSIILVGSALYYIFHYDDIFSHTQNQIPTTSSVPPKENTDDTLPSCKHTPLIDMKPIVIDDVVKDCTVKNKVGRVVEGIGGGMTDYQFFNGTLMDDYSTGSVQCEENDGSSIRGSGWTYGATLDEDDYFMGIDAVKKIANKGYLYSIEQRGDFHPGYCKNKDEHIDPDCVDMYDSQGWMSGNNYFVAGFRDFNQDKKYYIINDILYDPGISKLGDTDGGTYMKESAWLFSRVENNHIVVKKIIKGQLTTIKNESSDSLEVPATSYTLETCKIMLD